MKINIKFGIGALLVAMLLVGVAFVPAVSAQRVNENPEEVPIGLAREIANAQLNYAVNKEMVVGWNGAHIGTFEKRFTSEGDLTAYDFKVEKQGEIVGQILVNALKHGSAIVALSANKKFTMGITDDLPFFQLNNNSAKEMNIPLTKQGKKKYWESSRDNLLTPTVDGAVSIQSTSKVLGIPHIWWDDGCTPTSGAMILTYYGQNGYPSLNWGNNGDSSDSGDGNGMDGAINDYTEELHNSMGTSDTTGGTPWRNAAGGLYTTVNAHKGSDVSFFSAYSIDPYTTFFDFYKSKMDQNLPMILHILTGNGRVPDNHSVASDGYYEDTTQKYYYIQDPNELYSYLVDPSSIELMGATTTSIG